MSEDERKGCEVLYSQVCRQHDLTTEFRGKLLALLPIASGAGVFLMLHVRPAEVTAHLAPVGLFGVLVTLGLMFHELRGIQNCKILMGSAFALEDLLLPGAGSGAFSARQPAAFHRIVGVTGAAVVIYSAVIGGWLYVAIVGLWPGLSAVQATGVLAGSVASAGLLAGVIIHAQRVPDPRHGLQPEQAVRRLVAAENAAAPQEAAALLSPAFTGITRYSGRERGREELLQDIGAPANPRVHRELEDGVLVWRSAKLAAVRSVVATVDSANPQAGRRRFRNTHVFGWENGAWRCLAWHVTEVPGAASVSEASPEAASAA